MEQNQAVSRHLHSHRICENLCKALYILSNHCLCNIQNSERCIDNENVLTRQSVYSFKMGVRVWKEHLGQLCKLDVKDLELWMSIFYMETIRIDELHYIITVKLLQKFDYRLCNIKQYFKFGYLLLWTLHSQLTSSFFPIV